MIPKKAALMIVPKAKDLHWSSERSKRTDLNTGFRAVHSDHDAMFRILNQRRDRLEVLGLSILTIQK